MLTVHNILSVHDQVRYDISLGYILLVHTYMDSL